MDKGDTVYAAYVLDGEVKVEGATVAAVGPKLVRLEGAGRAFHWKCVFPLGGPGYSPTTIDALEVLLADCETDVLRARAWLARTESVRDLVMATLAGEHAR